MVKRNTPVERGIRQDRAETDGHLIRIAAVLAPFPVLLTQSGWNKNFTGQGEQGTGWKT